MEKEVPSLKSAFQPDRYYTPQNGVPVEKIHAEAYRPTPRPESVIISKQQRVSKNENCCISCLLACFLCLAVKGENDPPPPSPTTSTKP